MSIQPNDSTARDFSWGKPDRPATESGQADLAGSPRTTATDTAAEHIRTATVDLRKFVSERRYEVGELNTRMARVEDELQQQNGRGKSLAVLGGVVAILSFLSTTIVWQLAHRATAIESAVSDNTTLVQQAAAAAQDTAGQFSSELAAQTATVARVATVLADVESASRRTQSTLASLGKDAMTQLEGTGRIRDQLVIANNGLAEIRREISDRLARHHDIDASERAALLRDVGDSMTRVETVMLGQATELQAQKQQLDAATTRIHETRRVMLGEATQAVSVQLEGLRQILDGLRADNPAATSTAEAVVNEPEAHTKAVVIETSNNPGSSTDQGVSASENDEVTGIPQSDSAEEGAQPFEAAAGTEANRQR
ncbi:MAG: hypothetical protein HQ464_08345 [Planctomycetes bacterium]|nr:hypothetical protein [Planctomycetota bacterium]